jgi:hypothetical protein
MPKARINLIKGDAIGNETDYRDALPENMTAVSRPILGAAGYMIAHPGLSEFATGFGIDRNGQYNERQGRHYRVSGTKFIEVESGGTVNSLGDISGSQRASMAYSFNTQAIVADGKMWLYDGATLNQVTDPNIGNPIDITWIDGYYFLTDGEFLYHTDINDEDSIDPLQFATSEFSPDPTLAVDKTSDNQVIVFNRYTTEYFINRATEQFAFQRLSGKAIKVGVAGTHCETELDGRFFILGSGKEEALSVYALSSGTYQRVATREIEKILAGYVDTELASAALETRVENKDKFIVVRLPRETLLYNHTIAQQFGIESAWTILKTGIDNGVKWRGINGVFDPRISSWVYGDNQDSHIGILDESVATQYGEQQEFILYTPFVDIEGASVDKIDIDSIPGHQINAEEVNGAISATYDGVTYGKEWFNLDGTQYNYNTRFIARRFGYVREYIGFKFRFVTPERVAFAGFEVTYG